MLQRLDIAVSAVILLPFHKVRLVPTSLLTADPSSVWLWVACPKWRVSLWPNLAWVILLYPAPSIGLIARCQLSLVSLTDIISSWSSLMDDSPLCQMSSVILFLKLSYSFMRRSVAWSLIRLFLWLCHLIRSLVRLGACLWSWEAMWKRFATVLGRGLPCVRERFWNELVMVTHHHICIMESVSVQRWWSLVSDRQDRISRWATCGHGTLSFLFSVLSSPSSFLSLSCCLSSYLFFFFFHLAISSFYLSPETLV